MRFCQSRHNSPIAWKRFKSIAIRGVYFKQIKLDEFVIMPNHIHGIIKCEMWDSFVGALHCNALKQEINTNHYFSKIAPKKIPYHQLCVHLNQFAPKKLEKSKDLILFGKKISTTPSFTTKTNWKK